MANKTAIEWCDYTVNPVKGLCPVGCPYCYARRMYTRYKWDTAIRYEPKVWDGYDKIPAGSRVFIGSTIDLFHDETVQYLPFILKELRSDLTNIFLTKVPQNLPRELLYDCHVGVSCENANMLTTAWSYLQDIPAAVKFISFEPLHHWDMSVEDTAWTFQTAGINWVIIGAQTPYSEKTAPKAEWVREIVEAADAAGVPVFLKNNLRELLCIGATPWAWQHNSGLLRQELPRSPGETQGTE